MNKPDNTLKILVTVSSILFLLIAIKTSYPADDVWDMTLNIAGKFVTYELLLVLTIYIAGPMVSDAMPGIWLVVRKVMKMQKSYHKSNTTTINPNKESPQPWLLPAYNLLSSTIKNQEPELFVDTDDEDNCNVEIVAEKDEIPEEIIEYTSKTFETILTTEQIEKIFSNLRIFNNGGKFEVIEKEVLPDYIYQFDILHFVWNISKRIYQKRYSKYKFRDRAAEFAKSSFPLTVTSALESIGSTMSNVDNRTCSLPIIILGQPLIPHDFSEVKKRKEKKKRCVPD